MKHVKKLAALMMLLAVVFILHTADTMAASYEAGGNCGADLKWSLDYDGNLVIYGEGAMQAEIGKDGWRAYTEKIKTVTIEKGVTSIGRNAFADCTNLKKAVLPSTLTLIDSSAFRDCTSLSDIKLPKNLKEIGSHTFNGCTSLTGINLPEGLTNLGDRGWGLDTFANSGLKSITIPSTVTRMSGYCFLGCQDLKTATVAGTNLELGYQTFRDCTSLEKVTIKKGVVKMSQDVFGNCTALTDVQLGADLTWIGCDAFHDCTALKEISIPDKVTELQGFTSSCVFEGCTSLEKVTFGVGLTKLGGKIFLNCTSLKDVYFCGDAPDFVGNETFAGCGNVNGYYPAGSSTWDASTLTSHGAERMNWNAWIPPLNHFTPVMKSAENINGGVKITWNRLNGANGYEVYRKTGNGTSVKAAALGGSATSWTDKQTANGTRYTYTIYGLNGSIKSKVSNARVTYYLTRNTASVSSKAGRLTVKWKKNSSATGYQIQYGVKSSFSGAAMTSAAKAKTIKKTLSLKKGKTYYVRVRSCKAVGGKTYCGAWSSAKKIKIK